MSNVTLRPDVEPQLCFADFVLPPSFAILPRTGVPATAELKTKRRELEDVESEIESLKSEYRQLEREIERLEKDVAKAAAQPDLLFPLPLLSDGLTYPEEEFLRTVLEEGFDDASDEKRLRAIIQNHACWWERVAE